MFLYILLQGRQSICSRKESEERTMKGARGIPRGFSSTLAFEPEAWADSDITGLVLLCGLLSVGFGRETKIKVRK